MSFWYKSAENCHCHPNCSCQAERQGPWTSGIILFLLTLDHNGGDVKWLLWKYWQILSPNCMCTSREPLYQRCSKNCEIWNFVLVDGLWGTFDPVVFKVINIWLIWCTCLTMAVNSKIFVFVNMRPYKFKRYLLWKYTSHTSPPKKKKSCILLGWVSTKVLQRNVKFKFWIFF